MWNKYENVSEKFKCFCNLCATKMNNNLEITSVRSSLDSGNKLELENHLLTWLSLQKPLPKFFIFATRKLWNYLVQVFLVGFSSFLLSDYTRYRMFYVVLSHILWWFEKWILLNKVKKATTKSLLLIRVHKNCFFVSCGQLPVTWKKQFDCEFHEILNPWKLFNLQKNEFFH